MAFKTWLSKSTVPSKTIDEIPKRVKKAKVKETPKETVKKTKK